MEWVPRWVWWFCSRLTVTLICICVLQALLANEGYHVAFKTMAVGAACLIVGVCVWVRGPRREKPKQDISWSG